MNADGHRKKAGEIESSLKELLPDSEGRHVVAVVELTFGILLHWIAFGMEKKFGKHMDTHVGLPRELRRLGERRVAEVFELFDCDHNPELGGEASIAHGISSDVSVKRDLAFPFSFVFVDLRELKEIESDFLWNVVREGIVVWGKPEDIISKEPHPSLKPLVVVSYSVEGLSETEKRRLLRRLYTSKNKLLDKKADWLGPGTILVSAEKFEDVRELFDKFHVKYSLKKVWGH